MFCGLTSNMLKLTNLYRRMHNKKELKIIEPLRLASEFQANFMCKEMKMTHENSIENRKTLRKRLDFFNFKGINIGENIAKQQNTDFKEVFKVWIQSDLHKKNILGDYSFTGIATCKGKDKNRYWVQVFGKGYVKWDGSEYNYKWFLNNENFFQDKYKIDKKLGSDDDDKGGGGNKKNKNSKNSNSSSNIKKDDNNIKNNYNENRMYEKMVFLIKENEDISDIEKKLPKNLKLLYKGSYKQYVAIDNKSKNNDFESKKITDSTLSIKENNTKSKTISKTNFNFTKSSIRSSSISVSQKTEKSNDPNSLSTTKSINKQKYEISSSHMNKSLPVNEDIASYLQPYMFLPNNLFALNKILENIGKNSDLSLSISVNPNTLSSNQKNSKTTSLNTIVTINYITTTSFITKSIYTTYLSSNCSSIGSMTNTTFNSINSSSINTTMNSNSKTSSNNSLSSTTSIIFSESSNKQSTSTSLRSSTSISSSNITSSSISMSSKTYNNISTSVILKESSNTPLSSSTSKHADSSVNSTTNSNSTSSSSSINTTVFIDSSSSKTNITSANNSILTSSITDTCTNRNKEKIVTTLVKTIYKYEKEQPKKDKNVTMTVNFEDDGDQNEKLKKLLLNIIKMKEDDSTLKDYIDSLEKEDDKNENLHQENVDIGDPVYIEI